MPLMLDEPTADGVPVTPSAPEPAAPDPQQIEPPAAGPWAADLARSFADEATRGQVDAFLRSHIQPHTTKLEQQIASQKDAVNLWQQLEQAPMDTYVQMTYELFGPEAADQVVAAIQGAQPPADEQGTPPQDAGSLDPRVQAAVDYIEQQQVEAYYNQELARIQAARPDVNPELLAPFVASADGDFDQAVQMYDHWLSQVVPAAPPAEPPPPAPPTIGSADGAANAATTPTVPPKQSIDEAIESFMAQRRPGQAPPVA